MRRADDVAAAVSQRWRDTGWPGWVLIAAGVTAWDALAPETMSHAFQRGSGRPTSLTAQALVWAYLTAHLFGVIPAEWDPLEMLNQAWSRKTGVRGVRHVGAAIPASQPAHRLARGPRLLSRPMGGLR